MSGIIVALVSGLLGAGFFGFVQFLITRKDNKTNGLNDIKARLVKAERDNVRLQMLVLMADYPAEQAELMKVAEHYFKDLKGDWYMTSLFNKYCVTKQISQPEWLSSND